MAIGSLLWAGLSSQQFPVHYRWLWPALLAVLLLVLEGVRVFVIGLHGDTMPLIILATLTPFALALARQPYSSDVIQSFSNQPENEGSSAKQSSLSMDVYGQQWIIWLKILLTGIVIATSLWLLAQSTGVPYNLRELFGTQHLIGSILFAVVLLWLGAGPWWIAQQTGKHAWPVLWLLLWLLLTGPSSCCIDGECYAKVCNCMNQAFAAYKMVILSDRMEPHSLYLIR